MAHRLPALQPLWSFVSIATLPHAAPELSTARASSPPVLNWAPGPDARPRPRRAVGRKAG